MQTLLAEVACSRKVACAYTSVEYACAAVQITADQQLNQVLLTTHCVVANPVIHWSKLWDSALTDSPESRVGQSRVWIP